MRADLIERIRRARTDFWSHDRMDCLIECERFLEALSVAAEPEPVAWRYWIPNAQAWVLTDDKTDAENLAREFPAITVEALVVASPPNGESREGGR